MKKIILISLFLVALVVTTFSQPIVHDLPAFTKIIHYKLTVGYNTTTVLIFPAPVKQADRGYKDLIAQKQPGVENVLKIKGARRDFLPTNLHVFTGDGRLYAFDVIYASEPTQTTFDLTKLDSVAKQDDPQGIIEFSRKEIDNEQLVKSVEKVRGAKPFLSGRINEYRMKLGLQSIYLSGNILLFGFEITNRSNLPYNIDFTRLYIRDKQKIKRSSLQEREIIPLYKDTVTSVAGETTVKWVVAVPKFTIPDNRQFVFEMYERNGGRHLNLKVKNRQLFEARNLQ
jgi:conjugative transposon TraN protein